VTGRTIVGNQPEPNPGEIDRRNTKSSENAIDQGRRQGDEHYPRIEPESRKRYWQTQVGH